MAAELDIDELDIETDIEIRDVTDLDGLAGVGALFDSIWRSSEPEIPLHLLRAISHTGGMVLGAYHRDRLIGAAFGFRCAGAEPVLHSHIVGVDLRWHRHGVGTALKHHQRQWCLRRGITAMTWTFDPLVRRNATFNIARLGAVGVGYLPDFYGPMTDVYNDGMPSDRLLVRWQLDADRRPSGGSGVPVLDVGPDGLPRPMAGPDRDAPAVRLRVPADQPRASAARLSWLAALRDVLAPRIESGHRLTEVTEDGWYVLTTIEEDR